MKITEGLRVGDLEELVMPLLSIDEFESKVEEDAIVVGFFVEDEDPAWDLAKFIEKGALDILDADVSPAPDENGYYMVFVEYVRNKEFPKRLDKTLDSILDLTYLDKADFKVKAYRVEDKFPYSVDNVAKQVRLMREEKIDEHILHWLEESMLNDAYFLGNGRIALDEGRTTYTFRLIAFNNQDELENRYNIYEQETRYDSDALHMERRLNKALGNNYAVNTLGHYTYLSKMDSDKLLVLKNLET